MKKLVIIFILGLSYQAINAQSPPEAFFRGIELVTFDRAAAQKQFELAQEQDSLFPGTYHFLGVIAEENDDIAKARAYYEKSMFLNLENNNRTREMTFVRLIDTYLQETNFDKAFDLAWLAHKQYPHNNVILHALQDITLWSFYIQHNDLNPNYLSPDLQKEYTVNSVAEEYLILRNIYIDGNYLLFDSQKVVKRGRKFYDIVSCRFSETNEVVEVKFKLNWDLNKFGNGRVVDPVEVYNNDAFPIHERIGALLVSNDDINIGNEIKKLFDQAK